MYDYTKVSLERSTHTAQSVPYGSWNTAQLIKAWYDRGISLRFFCLSKKKKMCSMGYLEFLFLELVLDKCNWTLKNNAIWRHTIHTPKKHMMFRANISNQKAPCNKYFIDDWPCIYISNVYKTIAVLAQSVRAFTSKAEGWVFEFQPR